jgi:drug/metabolite transporter (DMT)-like permease
MPRSGKPEFERGMSILPLWIPATVAAAAAQTARNATQRHLTETLGTAGATQVRFLYGLPFALLFLILVLWLTGERLPGPDGSFMRFVVTGAVTQIMATALMLAAMRERSFSLVTAYTKTEPVQVAVFGLAVLGDPLTLAAAAAILIATAGVVMTSLKPGATSGASPGARPVLLGIVSGGFFALAAISFRGATLALGSGSFVTRATTTLAWGLALQTMLLIAWLAVFNRAALSGSLRTWRSSIAAGFLGALASQFWFIGFALTSAANVRTLGLVEVPFAYGVSYVVFGHRASRREVVGIAVIVTGVALLLTVQ